MSRRRPSKRGRQKIRKERFQPRRSRRLSEQLLGQEAVDQIIGHIHLLGGSASSKDIYASLDWPRSYRKELQLLLTAMAQQGLLRDQGGKVYALNLQEFSSGDLTVNPRGFGFVAQGPEKGNDIFVAGRNLADAIHGDTVLVQITSDRKGRQEGRVVMVVRRNLERLVGIFHQQGQGGTVIPDDKRLRLTIAVQAGQTLAAKEGEAVMVQITDFLAEKLQAQGRVEEILGDPLQAKVQMEMVIRSHQLPHAFSDETMAQVKKIPATVEMDDSRQDLRHIPHVTIDGETARDFDDAVAVSRQDGGFRLYVSIADVSHYVQPGTPLDQDAYARGTSVYFPAGVLPMLPERLSNGLCSLNPDEDRYAFTAIIDFDQAGKRSKSRFAKSVIRSRHRLTYTKVWAIISGEQHDQLSPLIEPMQELGGLLEKRRQQRGSINFDLPEAEITINDEGQVEAIRRRERNQAHKLIEEFMLAANEAVANHLNQLKAPFLYRIHESPDLSKVEEFSEFAHNLLGKLPQERGSSAWFNQILAKSAGSPKEYVINNLMLRTMKQARYSPENAGHFGLAAPFYCHFTSPIRRYPDLQVHRALQSALAGKKGKKMELDEAGDFLSKRERVAVDAERDMHDRLKAAYMVRHLGETFTGIISGVSSYGLFVELDQLFVSGAVAMTDLSDDYFVHDEKQHRLKGKRSGVSYSLGDLVTVQVSRVDMEQYRINLLLAEED